MRTTIHGRLATRTQPSDLSVQLKRRDGERLASATPAADGSFRMIGLEIAPKLRHLLMLEIQRTGVVVDRLPVEPPAWGPEIELKLDHDEPDASAEPTYRVRGQVRDADGKPMRNLVVEVIDRDLRAEQRLGEATTDRHGRYCVRYRRDQFLRREKGSADIVVRAYPALGTRAKPIAHSSTQFNAGRSELIDLMVGGGEWAGPSEFQRVAEAVAPLLSKVLPATLTDDDLVFLQGETGLPPEEISGYVRALTAQRGRVLTADALYGLIRAGRPDTIADLARLDPAVVRTTLLAALDGNAVPLSVRSRIDAIVAALEDERVTQIAEGHDENSRIGVIAQAALPTSEERKRFTRIALKHPADDELWGGVRKDRRLRPRLESLRFAAGVTALVGPFAPLVKRLVAMRERGEVSKPADLVRYSANDWRSLLSAGRKPIGAPSGTPGSRPAARIRSYAETLASRFSAAFPTASVAAGVAGAAKDSQVAAFLEKHPRFEFGATTVQGFVAAHAPKTDPDTVDELKRIERLSKITPHFDHMEALRVGGLDSSRAIAASGKRRFAKRFASTFGSAELAEVAWERASWLAAAAQQLVAATAPVFSVPLPVVNNAPPPPSSNPAFPDWEKLFGSVEMCECAQCRTVLSPAAYFTDILHFLSERIATAGSTPLDVMFGRRPDLGEIELTCDNTNIRLPYIDLVNEVLERAVAPLKFTTRASTAALDQGRIQDAMREDFAHAGFPLSAGAKAGTVLSQHRWWVRDRGVRYVLRSVNSGKRIEVIPYPQTSGTAEELSANPEHLNDRAYAKLARGIYPWSLPFELPLEQTEAFVARMGVPRDELMRRYQPAGQSPTPNDAAIAGAVIGLGDAERRIIVGSHAVSAQPWLFWDASAPAGGADWSAQLQPISVLLRRARIDYGQLADLLELVFLNPHAQLLIEPVAGAGTETCDTHKLAISKLTGDDLDRIHRFIRLQRRLGWSARDLDRVLTTIGTSKLDDDVVRITSDIERLRRVLNVPVPQIAAWYGPIDTAPYVPSPIDATKPLYSQLFQNPSIVKRSAGSDPFALTQTREVVNRQPLSAGVAGADPAAVTQIRSAVAGALGISADDLTLLLDGSDAVAGANPRLTVETLSRLFRRVSLARALKLKIADLLALIRLTGIDPFVDATATPRPPLTPDDTRRTFALRKALEAIRSSGMTIAQVAYLLRGEVTPGSSVAPAEPPLATILTGLRAGLLAIRLATTTVTDPQGQLTSAALVALGWDDATVQQAVTSLGGTAVFTAPLANLPAGLTLPTDLPVSWDGGTLSFTGPMTQADWQRLDGLAGATQTWKTAVRALRDAPRDFVTGAMKTFVAPVYEAPLVSLDPSVQFPADVSSNISYDADRGVLSFLGAMTAQQQGALLGLTNDPGYQQAVNDLFGAPSTYIPPPGNAFLAATDADALFDTAMDPSARFAYVLPRLKGYLRATRSTALLHQTFIQALRLDADSVASLLDDWADRGPTSTHRPADDFLDDAFVTSSDTMTRVRFPEAFGTFIRLMKTARIVTTLGITRRDLAALLAHSDTSQPSWLSLLDLATLPVDDGDPAASFAAWAALVHVFRWTPQLPGGDAPSILGLLAEAAAYDPATTTAGTAKAAMIDGWVKLTDWSASDLEALLGDRSQPNDHGLLGYELPQPAGNAPLPTNVFSLIGTWLRIRDAMDAAARLAATPALCSAWSKPTPTMADALAVQQAARAQLGDDAWLDAFKSLRDVLRQKQRDALVDYLIANPPPGESWETPDDLFGYHLIDVEMDSCMVTSRIKQAIGSVQLFALRCLMNLEPRVRTGNDDGWGQWEWMSSEAVWAGAREIFLWPENWLEPDLRKDSSEQFDRLVSTLQQNPVTKDTAEQAFMAYLQDLSTLSRLEVVGVHHQVEKSAGGAAEVDILHVIARTQSKPNHFFYRRRINATRWTPWEQIPLDIEADSVLPVVWNRRLMLFWPLMKSEQEPAPLTMPDAGSQMPAPKSSISVQIAWSVFNNGKWGAKQLTSNAVILQHQMSPLPAMVALSSSATDLGTLSIDVSVNSGPRAFMSGIFSALGSILGSITWPDWLTLPAAQYIGPRLSFSGGLAAPRYPASGQTDDPWSTTLHLAGSVLDPMPDNSEVLHGRAVAHQSAGLALEIVTGQTTSRRTLLQAPHLFEIAYPRTQYDGYAGAAHFFYQDTDRSFLVERLPKAQGAAPSEAALHQSSGSWGGTGDSVYRFWNFYHPFVDILGRELNRHGIDALFDADFQVHPYNQPRPGPGARIVFSFILAYQPTANVDGRYPIEEMDYSYSGAYSQYNWELFFHAPLLIAQRLTQNQQFADAKKWLEYIFDPTRTASIPGPWTYWTPAIFQNTTRADYQAEQIQAILDRLASGTVDPDLLQQVQDWRADPFDPHAIAKLRTVAYQKETVMRYLDNLIAWGDQLFTQNTIETINQATQMYVLAAEILGPRPNKVPTRTEPIPQTYNTMPALGEFSDALVEAESLLAPPPVLVSAPPKERTPTLAPMAYFCIPRNEKLLAYWDTIDDRLFKIRHCMNIEGVVQSLPLFEPPIDPGLLVRAAAAGVSVSSALAGQNAPLPIYRFERVLAKAKELTQEVKSLGASLQAALEKRDAEQLAVLRQTQETQLAQAILDVRQEQINDAEQAFAALQIHRTLVQQRHDYYANMPFLNPGEAVHLALTAASIDVHEVSAATEMVASILAIVPDLKIGAPTSLGATFGGENLAAAARALSTFLAATVSIMQTTAGLAQTVGSYERRQEEWTFQAKSAQTELDEIDQQIIGAQIRLAIAQHELSNQQLQMDNSQATLELMQSKFTNEQLYDWMVTQISTLYMRAYQLAYDMSTRAERAYRHELGLSESSYIRFGYWDSLHKGLLAGERLSFDLGRLEASHLELNRREYELRKTISIAQVAPQALIALREGHECFVSLPDVLFDMDYPGHYMRRIKSVSLTIPCIAGPYTGVHATVTLLGSSIRLTDDPAVDPVKSTGAVESIATSTGQSDAGVFELNLRDERYLPFEGQGVISDWHIQLDPSANRFDFSTITDVLVNVGYTARPGGTALHDAAVANMPSLQQVAFFDASHDFSDSWYRFLHPADDQAGNALAFDVAGRFPFQPGGGGVGISGIDLYFALAAQGVNKVTFELHQADATGQPTGPNLLAGQSLKPLDKIGGAFFATVNPTTPLPPGRLILSITGGNVPASAVTTTAVGTHTYKHLDPAKVRSLYVVCRYQPAP
jgi:hypothetical protein